MPDSSFHKYWITELLLNCVRFILRNGAGMRSFKKKKICVQVNLKDPVIGSEVNSPFKVLSELGRMLEMIERSDVICYKALLNFFAI